MTPTSNVSYLFSRLGSPGFGTTFFQTFHTMIDWLIDWLIDWFIHSLIAGFGYGLMHCQKWLVDKIDKITVKVIVLVQSLTVFNWLIPIVSQLFGPIVPWWSTNIKDIRDQEKWRKGPENGVTSATIYWSLLRFYLLFTFWMNGISCSWKNVHLIMTEIQLTNHVLVK